MKLKIAFFALMGVTLILNAQIVSKNFNVPIANSYVKVYQITTKSRQLASNVKISATSHTGNHVGNFTAEILVNHHKDIFVKTTSGGYTQGTIKIESDNNGSYFMSYKTTSPNAGRYYFTIEALSSEINIVTLPTGVAPTQTVHQHNTNFGTHESSTKTGTGKVLTSIYGGDTKFSDLYLASGNVEQKGSKIYQKFTDNNGGAEANIQFYRNKSSRGGGIRSSSEIRFATTSSSYRADNLGLSTKMIVKGNGNVGIGVTTPSNPLHIVSSSNHHQLKLQGANGKHSWIQFYPNGTNLLNWQVGANTNGFSIYDITNSKYNFTVSNSGNVGIGTIKPTAKLAVNGKIHTKEIRVDLNLTDWADFVFYNDYKLPTLTEVENHIKEKGHLKDIPSAKEVAQNGIYLGEMDAKLLQKIEELTLYTIQQEKKIKTLEAEKTKTEKLEKEVETLKKLVSQLLKDKK
ncbi:tail fiber protein [Tenacibaculum sp. M341]|uniref:tail fiber protein n=1 Tax=Tenacibaculum sp. M341 TaxID=2530339 RepID=UPI001053008B|nr:tail fiber protein [Tenacibaculum sp. M341]TCI93094.1 hypothetical protein EYW44_05610 [Tenacibaculum sp. M341]